MVMSAPIGKETLKLSMFIDFDKSKKVFYNNFYLPDYDFVIKTPILENKSKNENIKVEEFDLAKYVYILDY